MIKTFAALAAAALLYIAVPTAPAAAQGISVQIGNGGHRGYHGGGYRHGRNEFRRPMRRGWDHRGPRGPRGRTVIINR
ncbi:hypothetical protein [Tardiphaga sp.]|uniref:hypothetical protein n=1 Tax=Tardiphaga sp. TaxID=1926292 RepID=UPI0019AE8418|nr:hypothetical protein [Tardiphaga sp.]MBC7580777.1 hypothetical protein [Tardiphaga sp.]